MERHNQEIYGITCGRTHGRTTHPTDHKKKVPIVIKSTREWLEFIEKTFTTGGVKIALEYARNNFRWDDKSQRQVMDALAIIEHTMNLRKLDE